MKKLVLTVILVLLFAVNSYAVNNSLQFDGVNDYLTVPDHDNWAFGTNDFTMELWFQLDSLSTHSVLIHQDHGTLLMWNYAHGLNFMIAQNKVHIITCWYQDDPTLYTTGTWYHVAVTRRGNDWNMYRDGTSVATTTDSDAIPNFPAPLWFGVTEDDVAKKNFHLNGKIDEIRFWNYGMTEEQINYWNQYSAFGNETGLIARWGFDEGSGQVAGDSTIYGNYGTLGSTTGPDGNDPSWVTSGAPIEPIPEPSTLLLFGFSLLGAGLFKRKRARR